MFFLLFIFYYTLFLFISLFILVTILLTPLNFDSHCCLIVFSLDCIWYLMIFVLNNIIVMRGHSVGFSLTHLSKKLFFILWVGYLSLFGYQSQFCVLLIVMLEYGWCWDGGIEIEMLVFHTYALLESPHDMLYTPYF